MDANDKTAWDVYYEKPYITAKISRYFSTGRLIRNIRRYGTNSDHLTIAELGGAGSSFYLPVNNTFRPDDYYIFDNNQLGLDMLLHKEGVADNLILKNADILSLDEKLELDVVYSIGLIEHFTRDGTAGAIKAHFDLLKPGGIAVISFPTPTWLYRLSRAISTFLGLWIWPDEVPLAVQDVVKLSAPYGEIVDVKTIWPMFLTHSMLVIRKS